jgi:hypothetical protein
VANSRLTLELRPIRLRSPLGEGGDDERKEPINQRPTCRRDSRGNRAPPGVRDAGIERGEAVVRRSQVRSGRSRIVCCDDRVQQCADGTIFSEANGRSGNSQRACSPAGLIRHASRILPPASQLEALAMKSLVLSALVSAAALAQSAEAPLQEATVSIDVRANALVPGSSEGVTKSVSIPSPCTYVSHHVQVLERQPPGRADSSADSTTSYSAELRRDRAGRIDAVALTVVASVAPSLEPSAIGIRLSVVMRCG